ncbi:MAG: hypothetical protein L0Y71_04070 [Gemmataceae bacterium]|nr:hypothetical protein [Gemmataceae bacterium]
MSLYASLLTYLEQGQVEASILSSVGGGSVRSEFVIPVFLSPADPTVERHQGLCSYAANAQVFRDRPNLNHFPDGTSQTILFAEHYANCAGNFFYWGLDADLPYKQPNADGAVRFRPATFADPASADVVPVAAGAPATSHGSVSGLSFQVNPRLSDCDSRLAQSPHSSGMLAGMGDGSVTTIARGMGERTYWALVTPNGGEIQFAD